MLKFCVGFTVRGPGCFARYELLVPRPLGRLLLVAVLLLFLLLIFEAAPVFFIAADVVCVVGANVRDVALIVDDGTPEAVLCIAADVVDVLPIIVLSPVEGGFDDEGEYG